MTILHVFDHLALHELLRPLPRGQSASSAAPLLRYFAQSDAGLVRIKNQDAWRVGCKNHLFALADGIGGRRAGEVASQSAVDSLCHWMERAALNPSTTQIDEIESKMQRGFELVNGQIFEMACRDELWRGMGTTLCCLHLNAGKAHFAHVGDSRIYHWRKGRMRQLTRDHSLKSTHVSSPGTNQMRTILTRAIGVRHRVMPSVGMRHYQPGDRFLLCSDGLNNGLTHEQIASALSTNRFDQKTAKGLIDSAKDNGSRDNITVILVEVSSSRMGDVL